MAGSLACQLSSEGVALPKITLAAQSCPRHRTAEYPGSQKLSLYFSQPKGDKVELTAAMVGGGEIAGLLKFNNEDLVVSRNELGRLALAIGTELNDQNKLGLTLNGEYGKDLFKLTSVTNGWMNIVDPTDPDTPLPSATAQVIDSSALKASDYKIMFSVDSAGVKSAELIRLSDNSKTNLTITAGTGTITASVDGLTFSVPADVVTHAQTGQSILFQPFNKAADEISPLVHNAADLAVANAVTANMANDNLGSLQLTSLRTTDLGTVDNAGAPVQTKIPAEGSPATIRFTDDDGSYEVTYQTWNTTTQTWDAATATGSYTSGQPISVNGLGWSITMTGTPKKGDSVSIGNALDLDEGFKLNAGNATSFLDLRDKVMFDGGTTLTDGFSAAMAIVGTRTQSAKYAAELSDTVAKNLDADRTAISGVNLDEEAARLLQYQQAYQASAKIIQTAQSLFDSVLNAVGGR